MSEAKATKATSTDAVAADAVGSEALRPRYHRILLKLSGEALLGSRQYGVDRCGRVKPREHSPLHLDILRRILLDVDRSFKR